MFDMFGWPKASKCKKVIKRARCQLRLLKNKRDVVVRQLREDVAELIKNGYEEIAVNGVEQIIRDESLAAAYQLLDYFCEFILTQLSYIRKHKDCPNDIKEAVSSLIFASARCGDLPELCVIRKLFGERYGENFAITAVELYPGNLVNHQIKENLSAKSVPDDLKYRVVDEIARDYCLQPELLAIEYYPVQVKENKGYQLVEKEAQINDTIAGSQMHPLVVEEIGKDVISIDSCITNSSSSAGDSCSLQGFNVTDSSALISTGQQYLPYILSSPQRVAKVANFDEQHFLKISEDKVEIMALPSSEESETSPPFPHEMVGYVDDIEKCQLTVSKDGACQDQRLFKFRSSGPPGRERVELFCDQSDIAQDKPQSEKSSTSSSRKKERAPEKTSRRISVSLEKQGIADIGSMVYYHKPCRSPFAQKHGVHPHRKQQKSLVEGIPQLITYAQKRLKQHNSSEMERNLQLCQSEDGTKRRSCNLKKSSCGLDPPYCYGDDYDIDCLETSPTKPKRGIRNSHVQQEVLFRKSCHCRTFWNEESDEEMELITTPQRPITNSYSGAPMYNVFTYPECHIDKQNRETKAEISESMANIASSCVSYSRTTGSSTGIGTSSPYSIAVIMPSERQNDSKNKMLRNYSYPSQYPKHVHPKLPDYDDIAAKFRALKRERQGNRDCRH